MPTRADSAAGEGGVGTYVYGVVPGDVELVPDTHGIGDPPGEVTLVRHGELAALVSEIDTSRPIGRPAELKLHEQLLDATAAADVPVLPMRFGAVLVSPQAVVQELLSPNHDVFVDALHELEGRAEYVVHGRFVEDAILAKVVSENPAVASLRDQLREMEDDAAQDARIELGETINRAIEASRNDLTAAVIEALDSFSLVNSIRPPASELDAFHVAFLVELEKEEEFAEAVAKLAAERGELLQVRMRGPMAAFDFIVTSTSEGE